MELSGLQQDIFLQRYALPNEKTWQECAHRVASHIAQHECNGLVVEWGKKFEDAIDAGDFMPGGRILFGAGRRQFNMLNCYRLHPEDTVESIGKMIRDTYLISCGGGGIGFNFSSIRPKGDDIQNIRHSAPGAVSVMKMVNEIGHHVRSGKNRRTALIAILNVDHPDLFEFLHVKLDLKELTNFNISVGITNEFIKAVKKDKSWHFKFNGREYHAYNLNRVNKSGVQSIVVLALSEEDALGRAYNHYRETQDDTFQVINQVDIKAKDIWDTIILNSWKSGDPGIYNIDLANQFTNVSYFEELGSPNPCQPAWATVITENGLSRIGDIKLGDKIWSGKHWTTVINKVHTGRKPVYEFVTRAGSFIGTENHRIVSDGQKIEVGQADHIDTTQCGAFKYLGPTQVEYIMDGLVFGDGTVHKASNDLVILCIGQDDQDYFESEISPLILEHRPGIKPGSYEINTRILASELPKTYERSIPSRYRFTDPQNVASFLRGLYSANGSVVANRVTLKASSLTVIKQTQELLSMLGIKSYYTTNKSHNVEFSNGIYECRESYDLNISTDREKFALLIGFIQKYKNTKLADVIEKVSPAKPKITYEIVDKVYLGEEDVFDITVDHDCHTYWTGGLLVSNCGEIPLPPYGNCCLGHINLSNMYDTKTNDVNWKKLAQTIRIGIRFLDNVLTANHYPIPECKTVGERSRRIGLGVTGLHYLLLKLGYKYGNEKCLEFLDRLFATFRNEAYKASNELAQEKGAFPAFDAEKYCQESFFQQLPPRIQNSIRKHGVRNAVMLTIAPCGTNSMVLGVSSGIEPIFAPVYKRHYREGNIIKEEYVADALFAEYYMSGKDMKHFCGAYEVPVKDHLATQATIQKYIDSAISKTTNLPYDYPVEQLSEIILEHATYVKGFTIYREGSKSEEPLEYIDIKDKSKLEEAMRLAGVTNKSLESCPTGMCEL